ncbi:hypothetical protein HanIR_Chr12g0608021 [Helianthus annuus]|nr:hypothetical protein HanIR_Chr12g0608021 [Helianthus annuus]
MYNLYLLRIRFSGLEFKLNRILDNRIELSRISNFSNLNRILDTPITASVWQHPNG